MHRTSVLVVDKTQARMLSLEGADPLDPRLESRLVEIKHLDNVEWERLKTAEKTDTRRGDYPVASSRPMGHSAGASAAAGGFAARSSMSDAENAEEGHALSLFAKQVAHEMSLLLDHGRFERLVVVAGPEMLGVLRPALTPALNHRIPVSEVAKNMASAKPHEIHDALAHDHLVPLRNKHPGSGGAINPPGRH